MSGSGTPSRKTVLVADDDGDVREVVAEYLKTRGFQVVEATNGLEALLQVKRARPAGVVLDLAMPRLGGLDALKRIHAFDPTIIVVAVTGRAEPELLTRARTLGAAAAFAKPIELAQLAAVLGGVTRPTGDAQEPRTPGRPSPAGPVAGRVLVADDDPEIQTMVEEFLARDGYQVQGVTNGVDAVRAVIDHAADVVLLDINMPRLGGLEALTAIRAVAPDVQVIMLSGQTDAELARRTLAFGAFDYVSKPVDLGYLAESVRAAVTLKRLGAEPGENPIG